MSRAAHRPVVSDLPRLAGAALILVLAVLGSPATRAVEPAGECGEARQRDASWGVELQTLLGRQREALARGDFEDAIELQKVLVRRQCGNEYHWFHLAELYLQQGRDSEAIGVLEAVRARGSNQVTARLETEGSPLHPLLASEVFPGSDLAEALALEHEATQRRREEFRRTLDRIPDADRPPPDYVAKGACPFECCGYGTWSVRVDAPLLDRPRGEVQVGVALAGSRVEALTGEVHVRPAPVGVVHATETIEPRRRVEAGEIVFLLDYLGEGFSRAWVRGEVVTLDVAGVPGHACPHPDPDCWGERLEPGSAGGEAVWWIQIRLADGTEGWATSEAFEGMDDCA